MKSVTRLLEPHSGDAAYKQAQKFWTKLFGLNFAIGSASGIVMEFQFGTNWPTADVSWQGPLG